MSVYLGTTALRLTPRQSIGKGGEADVYALGNGRAAKIFKPPDHPDFNGLPDEQRMAEDRLRVHQKKLPALMAFRGKVPATIILPDDVLRERANGGSIVGYVMSRVEPVETLLRFSDRSFREQGVRNDAVCRIFLRLHDLVQGVHTAKIVIGDFNDLNVLVRGEEPFLIDTDSVQFGSYSALMFTARFVDPLHCDPDASSPALVRPYQESSDWYAFAVMLMQSLIFVGPYGGVYRPKDTKKRLAHDARPLHRITLFHPEVVYPKPAVHYRVLPDDLLQYFHRLFERDERGVFPRSLVETIVWQTCTQCATLHARNVCPHCATPGRVVKETVRVRGTVTATEIFRTSGTILFAAYQQSALRYLWHEGDRFWRDGRHSVLAGALDPQMRFRVLGDRTIIGKGDRMVTLSPTMPPETIAIDTYGNLPMFDVAAGTRFWAKDGRLLKDGELAPDDIGAVLPGQTIFWAGVEFGFGFYRAGDLSIAFVFRPHRSSINDSIKLPNFSGRLIDSTAVFSRDHVWFFAAMEERGRIVHRAYVIHADGALIATSEASAGDGSWLSTLRGKCAVGSALFASTDDGIVRVETDGGTIRVTREFPDTEPFVDAETHLFVDPKGLYAVSKQTILLLSIR